MHLFKSFPLFFIFMVINFILLFLIRYLFLYKNKSRDYKIYHFHANMTLIISYFIIFIIVLLYIRYLRWGFYIDLNLLYYNIRLFFSSIPMYVSITLIELLLIVYLLIIHAKNYMIRSLIKRYLYYYYHTTYKVLKEIYETTKQYPWEQVIIYPLYIRIIDNLQYVWPFHRVVFRFIYRNFLLPYKIITENEIYPKWIENLVKWMEIVILRLPRVFLIVLIISDCYLNNFILHYIFYYLPFFVIFQIYEKVTDFLEHTSNELNRIIYERYYEEENVLYINTTTEEDNYILNYISLGFKCPSYFLKDENPETFWEKKEPIFLFPSEFIKLRRFIKIQETPTLYKNSLGQISDDDITVGEIYK